MAETHDTIKSLLAEFRGYSHGMPPSHHVTMSWHDFRKMLDRLEAAHKRELGDCAKLREACANIAEYARSAQCHTEDAHVLGYLNQIEGWAKAALAAPARNCDVGTADDWLARFSVVCEHCSGSDCDHRLFKDEEVCDCFARWLQMPYEEGGEK